MQDSPSEAAADEKQPDEQTKADNFPEAAPTDLRRNVWLLIAIVIVVAVAWLLSAIMQARPTSAPNQEQPTAATSPAQPRRLPFPAPVMAYRVIGADRRYVLASEPLTVSPGGLAYRSPQLFDATDTAPDFEPSRLMRIPGRRADQRPVLSAADASHAVFRRAEEVTDLAEGDRVVEVSFDGHTKGYPVKTLRAYLGVRDTIGDTAVFVCWSNLTQTARCLRPVIESTALDWRDAGLVYHGNNALYDVASGSVWDSFTGQCLFGPSAGQAAQPLPVRVWPWPKWREMNPSAPTLVAAAAPDFMPGREPYAREAITAVDLYLRAAQPGSPAHPAIGALPDAKDFVLGIALAGTSKAYPLAPLATADRDSVTDSFGGRQVQVHVTSARTAYATCDGQLLDAPVLLWFVWREMHPDTRVYRTSESAQPVGGD